MHRAFEWERAILGSLLKNGACFVGVWASMVVCMALFAGKTASAEGKAEKLAFVHKPPQRLQAGTRYVLEGQITNNDDLDEVSFCFRRKGEVRYLCSRMTLFGGDRYRMILESIQVRKPAMEYYVRGVDVNKKPVALFASEASPSQITVGDAPTIAGDAPTAPSTDEEEFGEEEGKVFTASRKEERIQSAPAVVTVITEADIRDSGHRSLLDLMRYVVGIDINNNGHWPDIGMRGVNPRISYGEKIVVLLDGHIMAWRQFFRNYINSSWVSIDNIKRIEIIRGPGSALWGANALSGVINIITKTGTDLKGLSGTIGGSPLSQSSFLTLQGGQEVFGGLNFRASFSMVNENRSPILAPIYEFLNLKGGTPIRHIPLGDRSYSQNFFTQITWRGWNLTYHQSRYDPTGPMSSFSNLDGDDTRLSTDRHFVRLAWATLLGSWGQLVLWSSFDHYQFIDGAQYEEQAFDPTKRRIVKLAARDVRVEAGGQLSAQIVRGLSATVGFDFEYVNLLRFYFPEVWQADKISDPFFDNIHASGFLQLQYKVGQFVEFTLGGRVDYDQRYGFVATPRAAVVLTPGGGFYTKLLYGNAFKAPSFHDLYFYRKNNFYGNPKVAPESVHTGELQLGWSRRNVMAISLNGYFSYFRNLIAYAVRKAGDPLESAESFPESQRPDPTAAFRQKANEGDLYTYGGEAELRLFFVRGLNVRASFGVFFQNTQANGETKFFQAPDYAAWLTANLMASYKLRLKPIDLVFSLGMTVASPKKTPAIAFTMTGTLPGGQTVPNWTAADDPALETPWFIQSYFTFQVQRIFGHLDLILRLSNLLNRDNYDANNVLLYPQEKFDMMLWARLKY